jgi:hypothetical protein
VCILVQCTSLEAKEDKRITTWNAVTTDDVAVKVTTRHKTAAGVWYDLQATYSAGVLVVDRQARVAEVLVDAWNEFVMAMHTNTS